MTPCFCEGRTARVETAHGKRYTNRVHTESRVARRSNGQETDSAYRAPVNVRQLVVALGQAEAVHVCREGFAVVASEDGAPAERLALDLVALAIVALEQNRVLLVLERDSARQGEESQTHVLKGSGRWAHHNVKATDEGGDLVIRDSLAGVRRNKLVAGRTPAAECLLHQRRHPR